MMEDITTQFIIEKGLTYIVLPLIGFLIGLKMQVNKLMYDNGQSKNDIKENKDNIINFNAKLDGHSKRLNKLDKDQAVMDNNMKHINDNLNEIKDMLKEMKQKY